VSLVRASLLGWVLLGLAGCVVESSIGRIELETGESGDLVCSPAPEANTCEVCEADMCCGESMVCTAEPICVCLVPCLLAGHSPAACETNCGVDHGESSDLIHCLSQACSGECGL
jgi:hypothetical protein